MIGLADLGQIHKFDCWIGITDVGWIYRLHCWWIIVFVGMVDLGWRVHCLVGLEILVRYSKFIGAVDLGWIQSTRFLALVARSSTYLTKDLGTFTTLQ